MSPARPPEGANSLPEGQGHRPKGAPVGDSLIADSAARLFAAEVDRSVRERAESGELDARLWRQVVDAGFAHALANESAGGIGASWADVFPILHGLGYWQVPLPLAETMVGALLLSLAGIALPDGPLTLIEQGLDNDLRFDEGAGTVSLSGTAQRVPWARHAVAAVVSLADGRIALLHLGTAAAVTVQPHTNHAGLPSDTLLVDRARCTAVAPNPLPLAQPVWTLGAIARSAMIAGALESVLEQAVRHAGERVQFGRPIGANQAIQQPLAVLAGDATAARVAALIAADEAPSSGRRDCTTTVFSAAVAKVRCGEAATRSPAIAHQVLGAIGFTHEHALHFATRRLWAWREEFGSDAWWAQRLGRAAIEGRADAFWPAVTARTLA